MFHSNTNDTKHIIEERNHELLREGPASLLAVLPPDFAVELVPAVSQCSLSVPRWFAGHAEVV